MTTLANIKLREFRLRKRYHEVRDTIYRRLHQSNTPSAMGFINHLSEVEDWIAADQLNDMDVSQHDLDLWELRKIDAALLRICSGVYGVCEECGKKTPERLDANPYARRCIDCQNRAEHMSSQKIQQRSELQAII